MQLTQGQKVKVQSLLNLVFDSYYDISCFCLNEQEKLVDEDHMIFYNQLSNPNKAIVLQQANDKQTFSIDLDKLSNTIQKLTFVITYDDKPLKELAKKITCDSKDFNFSIDSSEFKQEKAVMFCEIYKKENQWRYNAFAQGFNAGLPAVLALYNPEGQTVSQPAVEVVVAPKPITLTKLSLNKDSKPTTISLKKNVEDNSMIEVSAKWYDNGDGNSGNDDLDLRVGLLLPDGRMTMVHSAELGNLNQKPYIAHLGDVQVVQGSEGVEKVQVNPKISQLLGGKVAIVFSVYSAVGNGVVSVASLRPIMEIKTKDHLIHCEFNTAISNNSSIYTYVIGMIVIDGDELTIKQLSTTSKPSSEDTPWLEWDKNNVLPTMEIKGPKNFKGQRLSQNVNTSSSGLFGSKTTYQYIEHSNM